MAVAEHLPAATLLFLRESGVPDVIVFRSIRHVFTLDMESLLNGEAYQLGSVDRGSYSMALQRTTGHFGYVIAERGPPSWVFCNSSVECFLTCFAASERLWQLEDAKLIGFEASGEWLEREIRQIDPVVFADENNIWAFLVEELRNGVV